MNETGRVTSTARKISRSWLWRLFWIFFRINLVLLILAVLGFCFYQERAALGSQWSPDLGRELQIEDVDTTGGLREVAAGALDSLRGASYIFYGPDGVRYEVACRAYVDTVGMAALVLLAIETLIFLGQMMSGRKKARLLLRPLVAGVSYELLKGLAHAGDANPIVRALKKPGMILQKLTTAEPDDDMCQVAIEALKCALNTEDCIKEQYQLASERKAAGTEEGGKAPA